MFKRKINRKGFTLLEVLISTAIFVAFTSILMSSYTSIVRAQREANEYRLMYAEARNVFDTLVRELRDGMVDYGNFSAPGSGPQRIFSNQNPLVLVSKDAKSKTQINYVNLNVFVSKTENFDDPNSPVTFDDEVALNSDEVQVTDFMMYVNPGLDPYDPLNVLDDSSQFHPMVTIYAEFTKELPGGDTYTMDLQTTVSSRIYNQVYPLEIFQPDDQENP